MGNLYFLLVSIQILCLLSKLSTAADSVTISKSLLDDGKSLVSNGHKFELGFFSPGPSNNRYVGIWYNNIPVRTVVWVANRDSPINDTSGILMINRTTGGLDIVSHNGAVTVWSAKSSRRADNPIAQLLDSGNLVLRDEKDAEDKEGLYLWQSFDYPADTVLPGMKIGWDLRTGLDRRGTAWKNWDDPSPGELTRGVENAAYPEIIMRKRSQKLVRSGPWNGIQFSGSPELVSNPVFSFNFIFNKDEAYYIFHLENNSRISRMVLNETTKQLIRYAWLAEENDWTLYSAIPRDRCDNYGECGAYGICSITGSPICQCLKGFKPKGGRGSIDWSQGCVRNEPFTCSRKNGFEKITKIKLPDTMNSWLDQSMNLKQCREKCLNNCSCVAYTNSDIRGRGSGCAIWTGDLFDIKQFAAGGQDLYIRVPFSKSEQNDDAKILSVIVIAVTMPILVAMLIIGYCYRRKRNTQPKGYVENDESGNHAKETNLELLVFDQATIVKATDKFSMENKLGQGGFGPVYKGILEDGQEIAVKRLSIGSDQGQDEFKNEVILIAKLQHRNLVKLLGCCLEGDEKMLVYEYMPNKSLDHFIFDQVRGKLIDWPNRFSIICGIARGLLYLHQDSRLRIIHRDLKASNVLLDKKMNPKISDFGMAKTFGGDQTEGNTTRVVGTYGYMAPEYAIDGLFSIKSDVFSFGILLLEIVSGKKNRGLYHRRNILNLIEHVWLLWKDNKSIGLVDEMLVESYNPMEVARCIHIGLLCVQQHPEDRPGMASVVVMLGSENELPQPKKPALFVNKNRRETSDLSSSSKNESCSINEVTISLLEAR